MSNVDYTLMVTKVVNVQPSEEWELEGAEKKKRKRLKYDGLACYTGTRRKDIRTIQYPVTLSASE
jgi:hypothetical protein